VQLRVTGTVPAALTASTVRRIDGTRTVTLAMRAPEPPHA